MGRGTHARMLLTASLLSLALIAAACDGGADGEEGEGNGATGSTGAGTIEEVTWALPDLPDVLLVPHDWTTYSGAVMSLVEEGALAFGDDLSLQPAVAETWEAVDPTTYVFTLRDGVTFHDGSPLTAEDVVFTIEWNMDKANASQLAAFFASVKSVEATADNEVTVTLSKPDAQFQYSMAHMSGFIMNKAQLESSGETFGTPDVLPLGTGPYKLVEFVPDDHVTLERYEDYWGEPGAAQRIVIRQIPDSQTRLLAMQSGEIDGTFDVPISEVDQWEGLDGVTVITAPSNGVYQLILDQETPPFDDLHVRRRCSTARARRRSRSTRPASGAASSTKPPSTRSTRRFPRTSSTWTPPRPSWRSRPSPMGSSSRSQCPTPTRSRSTRSSLSPRRSRRSGSR